MVTMQMNLDFKTEEARLAFYEAFTDWVQNTYGPYLMNVENEDMLYYNKDRPIQKELMN